MGRNKGKENRNKAKTISYTSRELAQLEKDFAKSSCRTLSQYIRAMSLQSPFDIYRNRSFDGFVEEIILLRKEMREIAGKILLTKESEKRLLQLHEEIKTSINKLVDLCMQE